MSRCSFAFMPNSLNFVFIELTFLFIANEVLEEVRCDAVAAVGQVGLAVNFQELKALLF